MITRRSRLALFALFALGLVGPATAQRIRAPFWRKLPAVLTPSGPAVDFNYKCAQTGVIACYSFDSAAATRTKPTAGEPMKYSWFAGACDFAALGTNYPIAEPRSSLQGNSFAVEENGVCQRPTIDTATVHSGTGSLHLSFPSHSDSQTGGYFTVPFEGLDADVNKTWGVDRLQHRSLWIQFYYRTHNMHQAFNGATVAPVKIFAIFPELDTSSTITSVVQIQDPIKTNLLEVYTHSFGPNQTEPHEQAIPSGGTTYEQVGSRCPYDPTGVYADARCIHLQDDVWQEMTQQVTFTSQISDGVVSGTTLSSVSAPFDCGTYGNTNFDVYILGYGLDKITACSGTSSVTLATAPGNGSNLTVYIGNAPNGLHVRSWIDGKILDDYYPTKLGWGFQNTDIGFAQFDILNQSTSKDSSIAHTPGDCWYDELIISTDPIPFGSAATYLQTQIAAMVAPAYIALNATPAPGLGGWNNFSGIAPINDPIANVLDTTDNSGVIGNGSRMEFDPVTRRMFHIGAGHRSSKSIVVYDERTNDTCLSEFYVVPDNPLPVPVPPGDIFYFNHCGGAGPPIDLALMQNLIGTTSLSGGSGYTAGTNVATIGGTGSGLKVTTTVSGGTVTSVAVSNQNQTTGYVDGDVIGITGGGGNATFQMALDLGNPITGNYAPSHTFETEALDPIGRKYFYWFPSGSGGKGNNLAYLDLDYPYNSPLAWGLVTKNDQNGAEFGGEFGSLAWFSDMGPQGSLVEFGGGNSGRYLFILDWASQKWRYIDLNTAAGDTSIDGTLQNWIRYVPGTTPTNGHVVFGGGNLSPSAGFWSATTSFTLGTQIFDSKYHLQQITTAGTTSSTFPSFVDSCIAICGGSPPTITDGSVVWTEIRNVWNQYTFTMDANGNVAKIDNNPFPSGTSTINNSVQAADPSSGKLYMWYSQPYANPLGSTGQIFRILDIAAGPGSQWTTGAASPAPLPYNSDRGGVLYTVCGTMWGRGTVMCFKYRQPTGTGADMIIYKAQ